MPLVTQIIRDDKPLPIRWGFWHVVCMSKATARDRGVEYNDRDLFATLPTEHVVIHEQTFTDPSDGEVLTLLPGDVLVTWREMK